ncbi:MAG: aminoacyltransferase [Candidatus Nomurabacteria bacterium]|jgi:lipid II:glycine glycyltransferase (peptidoglycan interpeptide bridge formation enzyme)|nr:aminoacyltransferase [Candidatus Nomurabacteria bacterium]
MKFIEIDGGKFEQFAFGALGHNFMQSAEFATVRRERGAEPKFFAVIDNDKIALAGLCGLYPTSLDCLCGPVADPTQETISPKTIKIWTDGLTAYARQQGKIFLTMNPFFAASATMTWQQQGWRRLKRGREGRLHFVFARPLPADTEAWFNSLHRKVRWEIRNSAKNGLSLRDLSYDELPLMENVLKASADRKNFNVANLAYLQSLYRAFETSADYKVRFVIVESADQQVVAGGVFVFSKLEAVHFFGGNSARSLELGGMYFLLDAMIRSSIEQGIPRFNFFGISGPDDSGLTFKRKWGGQVEEYFGVWAIPVDKFKFIAWKFKQLLSKSR